MKYIKQLRSMFNVLCSTRGSYTLIEILVAVGVFFIVIAAPTGFFVGSLKGQQKALSSQELLDQTSYVLEYMSRAIRMAKKDKIGDCISDKYNYENPGGMSSAIRFINYDGRCQEFFLDLANRQLYERKSTDGNALNFGSALPLTSDKLEIISFEAKDPNNGWRQYDEENQVADKYQPRVTLFLEIKGIRSARSELQPVIKIQTTISQRNLDVIY